MILTKEIATGFRDLDGDGVEDVFLTDASMECGNGGCTYRLIVSNNGVPKNIGEIEAKTIEALSATSNGLRDLKTVWQSGCVSNLVNVMKFDGVKYNLVKSYEEPGSCASEQSNKVISNGSTNVAPQPISSSNPRQLNQQAIVQIRNGQYKEAVMLLQEASSIAPQDSEILGNLGYALLMGGDPIRAEVVLKKALAIKPNRGSTLNNLGLALAAQGHEREAKDLFVRYVAASANKTAAFNQLQAWSTSPDASLALRNAASEALSQTR
jgi:tetratricopeptide (TPR) repeat protein